MRLASCLLVAALLLAVPLGARAQPDAETGAQLEALRAQQAALIRPLLASGDDRQIAWAATWARELSLGELVPDLLELLRAEARDEEAVGYYGMLAIFDALLHLDEGGQVELETLRPLVDRRHGFGSDHKAAAIVLVIRSGNPHTLLELFELLDRDEHGWQEGWLALGNSLAAKRVPGFAARVLGKISIDVEVTVRNPDQRRGSGSGRSVLFGSGDGRLPERKGYPRMWRYELTLRPRAGDALLADGPTPVYLHRREALRGFGRTRSTADRPRDRIAWIAQLLRTEPDYLELERRYRRIVLWTTPEAFLSRMEEIQREIRADFQQAAQQLLEAGQLGDHEVRTAQPHLEVTVRDDRDDKSDPLPSLPGQER